MLVFASWLSGHMVSTRPPCFRLVGLVAIGLMWGPEMSFYAAMRLALAAALGKLVKFLVGDRTTSFSSPPPTPARPQSVAVGISSPLPHVSPAATSASLPRVSRAPAPLQSQPTPGLLQTRFPQDLLASEILPYLTPYEVTQLLPTCRLFNQAGEQPVYWKLAAQRGRLALLTKFDEKDLNEEEQNEWDLSDCENPKLEFFRRTFLLPYQLAQGHTTQTSCRVIVQSKVHLVRAAKHVPAMFSLLFPSIPHTPMSCPRGYGQSCKCSGRSVNGCK